MNEQEEAVRTEAGTEGTCEGAKEGHHASHSGESRSNVAEGQAAETASAEEAEEVEDPYHELLFNVRLSIRYHKLRQAWRRPREGFAPR